MKTPSLTGPPRFPRSLGRAPSPLSPPAAGGQRPRPATGGFGAFGALIASSMPAETMEEWRSPWAGSRTNARLSLQWARQGRFHAGGWARKRGNDVVVKGEALARVEAEKRLLSEYRAEYERLVRRADHIDAVRSLVKTHKLAYDEMIRRARTRVQLAA